MGLILEETFKRQLPEEQKRKISQALKGRILSQETRDRISIGLKGKKNKLGWYASEETKKKISEALKGNLNCIGKQNSLGYNHTEETKLKLSMAGMGRKCPKSEETRFKISQSLLGRPIPDEIKVKISESLRGPKSHLWQGGKSFELYTLEFNRQLKELIRDRDDHKCQSCGILETELPEKLDIHHIDYDKKNTMPSNLISLCRSCHTGTSHNRDYWLGYFGIGSTLRYRKVA